MHLLLLVTLASQPIHLGDPRPAHAVLDWSDSLSASKRAELDVASEGRVIVVVLADGRPGRAAWAASEVRRQLSHAPAFAVIAFDRVNSTAAIDLDNAGPQPRAIVERHRQSLEAPSRDPLAQLVAETRFLSSVVRTGDAAPAGSWLASHPELPAGVGALGLIAAGAAFAGWLRRRPRRCFNCGRVCRLLTEAEGSSALSEAHQLEERLGAAEHDVWCCEGCGAVKVLTRASPLSSLVACGQCGVRAAEPTTVVLERARPWSPEVREVTERCQHCGASITREETGRWSWDSEGVQLFVGHKVIRLDWPVGYSSPDADD